MSDICVCAVVVPLLEPTGPICCVYDVGLMMTRICITRGVLWCAPLSHDVLLLKQHKHVCGRQHIVSCAYHTYDVHRVIPVMVEMLHMQVCLYEWSTRHITAHLSLDSTLVSRDSA